LSGDTVEGKEVCDWKVRGKWERLGKEEEVKLVGMNE
jgi:hypothetical protein